MRHMNGETKGYQGRNVSFQALAWRPARRLAGLDDSIFATLLRGFCVPRYQILGSFKLDSGPRPWRGAPNRPWVTAPPGDVRSSIYLWPKCYIICMNVQHGHSHFSELLSPVLFTNNNILNSSSLWCKTLHLIKCTFSNLYASRVPHFTFEHPWVNFCSICNVALAITKFVLRSSMTTT